MSISILHVYRLHAPAVARHRGNYWYTVSWAHGKSGLVVADGHESKLYDDLTAAQFVAAGNSITSFARKGSRILKITVALAVNSATEK
jgi:hypothetical protein